MDSFKAAQDAISAALVSTTRSATQLAAADIAFQRSLHPDLGTALDTQNARLLQLAQRLLENAAASSDAVGPKLPDVEAIDGNWRGVVDVVDSLLERADTSLDEYTGVVKRLAPSVQATAATKPRFPNVPKNLPKPQLAFEHVPNNNESGGFRPLLSSKPHAQIPLDESLETFRDSNGREQYPHPYQAEIESYKYPASMYKSAEPKQYAPFESTTATFVDTPGALAAMLAELKTAKEIAIDLEHHDNRSYVGIVSLMQISTRNNDWIIDTLKPWRRRLECLNQVFADPSIIKVLHGAYMDIVWLQRDLGLYIVGLFDTFHAARALGYPGASLAFLLDKFIMFKAQKQYQTADWRIRPLSDELFDYARADTHFLLYIFDNMRNELLQKSDLANPEKDKISDVLEKSRETALQRYEHPIYDTALGLGPGGWYKLISRTPVQYTPQQFSVFRAVHKWRDEVARAEDESTLFIMPNHAVFSIARMLPADKAALFNIVQHVSHFLRIRADELVAIIAEAKEVGDTAPNLIETLKKIEDLRYAERGLSREAKIVVETTQTTPALQSAPTLAALDTPPLRAPSSKFWGDLWSGVSVEQRRPHSTMKIDLPLPLPPLTAEIFANIGGPVSVDNKPKVEKPTYVPKDERPAEDERSDIFIVKQLGGKRKRSRQEALKDDETMSAATAEDAEMAEQADEIMLDDYQKARRRSEKEARKATKLQTKQRDRPPLAEDVSNNDEEPAFDYASAPSVLRIGEATRDHETNGKRKKERKKKNQGFNPYAKLADVPKGLPRTQKESVGKSRTFKF